ncbi:simple sugar transport system permease protein [Kribbella steppae]|uniref:Simple sugar transport system permease protein n=1 Tax=Kribbella steppae TaxID=2512223 RepID=A0A4R2HRA4_9ACTN|nr:ABC transporter permease [Kribbella steppae]TCO33617.1 simple sugar transport system permease protein [Kribbella steppae]
MTMAPEELRPAGAPSDDFVRRRQISVWIWLLVGLALLSAVRVLTGAHEVDSAGTMREAVNASVPIALAALAGLWSERAGVVNIGLEGMMILGTIGAGYFGYWYGPWAGIVGGMIFGMIGAALHALATVTFGVDHIVSGVAINIIALGTAAFLADTWFSGLRGGGPTQSPPLDAPLAFTIPGISDAMITLQEKHWFIVSDLASLVAAVTTELSTMTLLAIVLIVGSALLLWRTAFGLRLRSCGESPVAAETLGVNVYRYKFIAVLTSGAIAGAGGAFIALVSSGIYQNGQTGGRGYIGLAAMIFGNWRPGGLVMGSVLFGYTDALQLRAGGEAVHALLIIVTIILLGVAVLQFRRGLKLAAATSLVIAIAFAIWFFTTGAVPADFTRMTPYVTTLLVLGLASQRLRMPAADGLRYRRGQAG